MAVDCRGETVKQRSRHDARIWATQFLFQREFNRGNLDMALGEFWRELRPDEIIKTFTEELIRGVLEKRKELDALLQRYAEHWDLKRMGLVDRNVLRVALYEMLHRPDIPPVVSINEAVDVAKELSSRESGRFVNGLLDRVRGDLDRPARVPQPVAETLKKESTQDTPEEGTS